jgi:hypothetical protein
MKTHEASRVHGAFVPPLPFHLEIYHLQPFSPVAPRSVSPNGLSAFHHVALGSRTRPMKRIVPVGISRITKMKGRVAKKSSLIP